MRPFLKGFSYAWAGLRFAFVTQRNMRIHCLMALLAMLISGLLGLNSSEWAILLLTLALVLSAEIFNTALEITLDLISQENHPQIKDAKDLAAGAVLLCALFALGVGACLWGKHLWMLFQTP